jgi:hypothetical protein
MGRNHCASARAGQQWPEQSTQEEPPNMPAQAPRPAKIKAIIQPGHVKSLDSFRVKIPGKAQQKSEQEQELASISDAELVKSTLRSIMRDDQAPAAAKAQAARTMAEINRQLGAKSIASTDTDTAVRGMTRAQIEAALALEG